MKSSEMLLSDELKLTDQSDDTRSKVWLGLLIASAMMLTSGSCDALLTKFMDHQMVPKVEGGAAVPFESPFFQTFIMYIGGSKLEY